MRSLLDVNLLIALLDPEHSFHDRVHRFFSTLGDEGWATCPLTENGALRILSNENYPGLTGYSRTEIFADLRELTANSSHEFWADDISLLDETYFNPQWILGAKQLTDLYLVGLAAAKQGRLVTFDTRISVVSAISASESNLLVI